MKKRLAILSTVFIISACIPSPEKESATELKDESLHNTSRISTTPLAVGSAACEYGGVQIESGFDLNDNKVLDNSEITTTKIVCNGSDGNNGLNSLVRIHDEPEGVNCPNGGKRITSGLDENSDSHLSTDEIDDTQYLCNIAQVVPEQNSCSITDNSNGSATITCADGTTADILNGSNGSDGSDGSDGSNGTDGSDGSDGSLVRDYYCTGELEGWDGYYWEYNVQLLNNEDVFITGSIYGSVFETSKSLIYSPLHSGYEEAPIFLGYDVISPANFGYWKLSFDQDVFAPVITYNDIDATNGFITWVIDPDLDCEDIIDI